MNIFVKLLILLFISQQCFAQAPKANDDPPFIFDFNGDNCINKNFTQGVILTNLLQKKIRFINTSGSKLKIQSGGRYIKQGDTLVLDALEDKQLYLETGNIPVSADSLFLSFKTDLSQKPFDSVYFPINQFQFTACDFLKKQNKTINMADWGIDSIKLDFPTGGTVTSISIFKAGNLKKPVKETGYAGESPGDQSIYFTKEEKGRYLVELRSCHWAGRCWLTIK